MGLDVSHNAWNGAYGAFSRWRDELARVAGYDFSEVKADDGVIQRMVDLDWGGVRPEHYQGEWNFIPCRLDGTPDPLIMILVHSDCDGIIRPEHTKPIADRVAELLPLLPDGDGPGHVRNWRTTSQKFIDGLMDAHSKGEAVEFW